MVMIPPRINLGSPPYWQSQVQNKPSAKSDSVFFAGNSVRKQLKAQKKVLEAEKLRPVVEKGLILLASDAQAQTVLQLIQELQGKTVFGKFSNKLLRRSRVTPERILAYFTPGQREEILLVLGKLMANGLLTYETTGFNKKINDIANKCYRKNNPYTDDLNEGIELLMGQKNHWAATGELAPPQDTQDFKFDRKTFYDYLIVSIKDFPITSAGKKALAQLKQRPAMKGNPPSSDDSSPKTLD